jgi:GDPmannose 4,6-dehydratase/GDP-4-dehydro-6-deoxy-D-mannose reductase
VTPHECDLVDMSAVIRTLRTVQPDVIFHLASHANVRVGFINPIAVLQNNIMATANLLEAVRVTDLDPWIKLCSSSEVYGQVDPEDVPIHEDCKKQPSNPYGVSKLTQDMLGYSYWRCYEMKIIRTRMFSYFNPRRKDLFATSFARQVARIEAGLQTELVHGNLDSIRTMIDIRDAMSAYWAAATLGQAGQAYNIGGQTTISVGEFLEALKGHVSVPIPCRVDPDLLRPADVTLQIPDTSAFVAATGWAPQFSFEESVKHLLDYWRERVAQET